MDKFKVLDRRGEEIGYGEKQTTRISSLIFLSFVKNLAITSYRNKAYLLICEKFQKDKHCRLAVRQVSMIGVNLNLLNFYEVRLKFF